MKFPTFDSHLF